MLELKNTLHVNAEISLAKHHDHPKCFRFFSGDYQSPAASEVACNLDCQTSHSHLSTAGHSTVVHHFRKHRWIGRDNYKAVMRMLKKKKKKTTTTFLFFYS